MTEPYLIAHVVRGEAAFDIAEQMPCPSCSRQVPDAVTPEVKYTAINMSGCSACEQQGFWWIIPTSGHRARPYWHWELRSLRAMTLMAGVYGSDPYEDVIAHVPAPPDGWPDHYAINNRQEPSKITSIKLEELGL